jgi:membrane protease YdiL (CAAX protease family)
MNNHEIKNIIYDLNPKNCLSKFQNPSPRYAFELVVICYGITILISVFTQDLPSVSFHKEILFEIPINIFNSTILNPILEEILFFGIPISLVNNPIGILVVGIMWTIFHLFAPMNVETYSLSLNAFIATLPVLFIHFKIWKSGLGWISTCSQFNNNNFDFPEFHIFLGVTVLSVVLVYFLQRRKEEKEYVKKILRKKYN